MNSSPFSSRVFSFFSEYCFGSNAQKIRRKIVFYIFLGTFVYGWVLSVGIFGNETIKFIKRVPYELITVPVPPTSKSIVPNCFSNITYSRFQYRYKSKRSRKFKVFILTFSRAGSLKRCLHSVQNAYYDGDIIDLFIFIDRSMNGTVDRDVISTAMDSPWSHGSKTINIWDVHVGLYGQWIDSYVPESEDDRAIILEDDIEVSPFFYYWLKGAHSTYSRRDDIFGYTLSKGRLRADQRVHGNKKISVDVNETAYLYLLVGSWGYAPEPRVWKKFRTWFHNVTCDTNYNPAVPGLVLSKWFHSQQRRKTMWTMWHIRFAEDNKLFTLYANLKMTKTLGSNWREPGLHFRGSSRGSKRDFDTFEEEDYKMIGRTFHFPTNPLKLNWDGVVINRTEVVKNG